MNVLYQGSILTLLVIGLITAVAFVGQHRPRQWRRVAAWDASGWVVLVALLYLRSTVLVVTRWPGSGPTGWLDGVFAIVTLVVIDTLLLIRVISYRSFRDSDTARHGQENAIT